LNIRVVSRIRAAMTDISTAPIPRSEASGTSGRPGRELAIVVPVFRAGDAAVQLVERLHATLRNEDWEVVFVDDNSPDGTVAAIAAIGDPRVRTIRRVGRSGLTQTCLVAMLASDARHVALLDGTAQYDATLLAAMLAHLRADADLVVAARPSVAGGPIRAAVRTLLGGATRSLLSAALTDPASGFFMIRRDALEKLTPTLSSLGHQVLLDLIATAHGRLRIVEIPAADVATSGRRSELKLALELTALLLGKFSNDAVSIRFVLFCLVGLTGVGVHLALLDGALIARLPFTSAQTVATIGAMIWNFSLNNMVTYGDQRLTGFAYLTGLLRFMIICGIGAVSNVGVASLIYAHDTVWWIAGLGGAVMGAVWNYAVSAVFVWRPR
jgi:dolichol-phosphate mannosyltransferase